jgi:hypothetical protein
VWRICGEVIEIWLGWMPIMSELVQADRKQVLAYRLAGQSLHGRRPASDLLSVLDARGIQDTPPGAAVLSLAVPLTGVAAADVDWALQVG